MHKKQLSLLPNIHVDSSIAIHMGDFDPYVTAIAITYEQLMLLSSYFQHFVLHHFTMWKCSLVPCTITVLTLRGPIPHHVSNPPSLGRNVQITSDSCVYVKGSCHNQFVLFVNFYRFCYRDTAVQS